MNFSPDTTDAGAVLLRSGSSSSSNVSLITFFLLPRRGSISVVEMATELDRRHQSSMPWRVAKFSCGKKPAQALAELGVTSSVRITSPLVEKLLEQVDELELEEEYFSGVQPSISESSSPSPSPSKSPGVARLVALDDCRSRGDQAARSRRQTRNRCDGLLTKRSAAWMFDACRVSGQENRLVDTEVGSCHCL